MTQPIHIVFPIFPQITQLDFTGPLQFLSRLPDAHVHVAAASRDPITTDCGFAIVPTTTFADCPQADIICVPGGHGVTKALHDGATVPFITAQAKDAQWITSVCTGAFLLGGAGLLSGKRATTHWAYTHLLPLVGAIETAGRVVEDGNIVTAGGVTSGIDFALTLIARIAGDDIAKAIQLSLEYDPAPPFSSGHPSSADPATLSALKARAYDAAAARMKAALSPR
ncbi:MAG: DJ-1/PfpI family protein [Sphingopyxis sp.]